ncbi:MAG: toprim domain-containing protein, partial [Oscillospiraceae bacterium]|nr:toprim domain-containing protein [Oscillospiraceae bacterium]
IAQHIYPYYDKAGDMVAQKIRTVEGKQFHVRGRMSKAVLFGQQLFPSKGKFVTVTEGELDALSVWQMIGGKSPVVSIKNGAAAVDDIKNAYEFLDGFDNIILCFDGDEAGQKAVKRIATILPPKKLRVIKLPRDMNSFSIAKS